MNFIKKHEVIFFYICTYMLTGLLFFLQTLAFPSFAFPLYLLAPATMAFLTKGVISKKKGISSFLKELAPKKAKTVWVVLSILLPVLLIFLSDIIFHLITGQRFDYRNITVSAGLIVIAMVGSLGEEIGWRSYLLPIFSKKHSKLLSSVFVGILWVLWHAGDYGQGLGFLVQIIWMIELSIIMTWLYYKGNKNLIIPVIFHSIFGISGISVGIQSPFDIRYHIVFAIVFAIPATLLALTSSVFKEKSI